MESNANDVAGEGGWWILEPMATNALGPIMPLELLPLIPLGLLAGVFSGLLGVGGGLVFSPILLLLGLSPHQALATSTLAIVPTTLGGTVSHLRTGRLPLRSGACVGLSAVASGLIFSRLGGLLSGWHLLALQALLYGLLALTIDPTEETLSRSEDRPAAVAGLIGVGAVGGFAGGLLGLGGGLLMVPLMVRGLRVPLRQAIRLSTLAVLCSSSAASLQFLAGERVNTAMALLLGGAAALSARWSAARLDRISERKLAWSLRLITMLLAADSGRRALMLALAN